MCTCFGGYHSLCNLVTVAVLKCIKLEINPDSGLNNYYLSVNLLFT